MIFNGFNLSLKQGLHKSKVSKKIPKLWQNPNGIVGWRPTTTAMKHSRVQELEPTSEHNSFEQEKGN